MTITNVTKNTLIANRARIADSFISRLTGLLGKSSLPAGEALVITRSNCIHMFFMRFAIDAIFVDSENRAVGLAENLKPFHISPLFNKASRTIEIPAGTIQSSKTSLGDILDFKS